MMSANSLRRMGLEAGAVLFVTLGSLSLLFVLESVQVEVKWIIYILACLVCGTVIIVSGNLRKTLLVIGVLSLQVGVSLYLTQPSQSWVGTSGPTAIEIKFTTIPAFALLVIYFFRQAGRDGQPWFWGKEITAYAVFAFATAALTILYTTERSLAAYYLIEQIQFYLIFFVIINALNSPRDVTFVVNLLMVMLVLQSLVYFVQNTLGMTFTLTGEIRDWGDAAMQRHGGTISTRPAPFASFILPLLFIAIARWFSTSNSVTSWSMGLLALMGMAALVLTYTRAAWVGFVLGLIWLVGLGLFHRIIRVNRLLVMGLVAMLLLLVLLPQIILRLGHDYNAAYVERFDLIRMAWQVIKANPVLGVGAGGYAHAFRQYLTFDLQDEKWIYIVHNVYLLRWAETGLFGLISFVLLWLAGLRQSFVCTRVQDHDLAAAALGISAGLVALMWEMFWDVTLGSPANAQVWLLFALLVVIKRVAVPPPTTPEMPDDSEVTSMHREYA